MDWREANVIYDRLITSVVIYLAKCGPITRVTRELAQHKILPSPKSQVSTLSLCTSIICHLFFSILNNLKPLKCTSGFFVDKLLLKIIDFHPIAKFDGTADFCPSRFLIILNRNKRCAIPSGSLINDREVLVRM